MRNVPIDYHGTDHGFQAASLFAKDAAKANQMTDPAIMAWHRRSRLGEAPPFCDGANPGTGPGSPSAQSASGSIRVPPTHGRMDEATRTRRAAAMPHTGGTGR
ncbi:MAG: AF1514 family protein [Thiobacillus sp.]